MNPECPGYDEQAEKPMELRAHHLFTFSRLHFLRAHKAEWRGNFIRNLKAVQFKLLGHGEGRQFADHLVDSVLVILKEQVGTVKLTDTYDEICRECPQRGNANCRIAGREWSENFLSMVDQAVVRNTNGVLEMGKEYQPAYLIANMGAIRSAMRKTLLELPGIWSIDKKLQQALEEERGK